MIVCKQWTSPAAHVYYEGLTLTGRQIDKMNILFNKKLPNQDDYFKNLHHTRKLTIADDDDLDLDQDNRSSYHNQDDQDNMDMYGEVWNHEYDSDDSDVCRQGYYRREVVQRGKATGASWTKKSSCFS